MKPLMIITLTLIANPIFAQVARDHLYQRKTDEQVNQYISQQIEKIQSPFDKDGNLILKIIKNEKRDRSISDLRRFIDYAISNGSKIEQNDIIHFKNGNYTIPANSKIASITQLTTSLRNQDAFNIERDQLKEAGLSNSSIMSMEKSIKHNRSKLEILRNILTKSSKLKRKINSLSKTLQIIYVENFNTEVQREEDEIYLKRTLEILDPIPKKEQKLMLMHFMNTSSGSFFIPSGTTESSIKRLTAKILNGELQKELQTEIQQEIEKTKNK
ncbi:hypothetical protein [Microbulbifer sp. SAOS-129_SWC]|uniref:hypothetical protein n=1 Tax=Microbulbifer sp. SAOS-129_SWC TaxID=3145235 RepID=UPI0032179230